MTAIPLLYVQNLTIAVNSLEIVRDVTFTVDHGETVAIVGESGCGKSLTAQAISTLFSQPGPRIKSGNIIFDNQNIAKYSECEMKHLLSTDIAFISQNPLQALNPTLTIGYQIMEAALRNPHRTHDEAKKASYEMLKLVGLSDIAQRFSSYPHELSGGMRQRVLIAMALINTPKILIADEPTTALDVTIQAEIIELLMQLKHQMNMALLFITHDLGVVAAIADKVAVMYAGQVVEIANTYELYKTPKHPYTKGLLSAIPTLTETMQPLIAIPGSPPICGTTAGRCAFYERCRYADRICHETEPTLITLGNKRSVRCFKESSI